jgi:hypothetical protein
MLPESVGLAKPQKQSLGVQPRCEGVLDGVFKSDAGAEAYSSRMDQRFFADDPSG